MPGSLGEPGRAASASRIARIASAGALRALLALCPQLVCLISGCLGCLLLAAPRRDRNLIIPGRAALFQLERGSGVWQRAAKAAQPTSGVLGWIQRGDRAQFGLGRVRMLPAATPSAAGELLQCGSCRASTAQRL